MDVTQLTADPLFRDEAKMSEVIVYKRKELLREKTQIALYGDRVVFDEGKENEMTVSFADADAVLTAPETRSSSPVRIVRDATLQSLSVRGLYPCGEGAGYAGGIMSAAVDGIRVAQAILARYHRVSAEE